jgi:hypothetical protein
MSVSLSGAELEPALRVGEGLAVALEARVARARLVVVGVDVAAVGVALPDLDQGISDGLAGEGLGRAEHVDDRADRRGVAGPQADEVGVLHPGLFVGIERPLHLRGGGQALGGAQRRGGGKADAGEDQATSQHWSPRPDVGQASHGGRALATSLQEPLHDRPADRRFD